MSKRYLAGVAALAVLLIGLCGFAQAADANPEAAQQAAIKKFLDSLKWQQGTITLGNNLATLTLPKELRYLGPEQSNDVLTKLWGNPPGNKTMGMLFPADLSPADDECWAVVITYDEDGYVKDDDAEKIDYKDLLEQMQESIKAGNAERAKKGYPELELRGWAETPRYDKATHKMYWAKKLHFGENADETLNYNIRILGRKGVLVLNVVSDMKQLELVRKQSPQILAAVNFTNGNRYEDFTPGSDKVATYGLAALVAGGIAAKVGFFKGIWIFLLAAKKLVLIGLIVLGGVAVKVVRMIRGSHES